MPLGVVCVAWDCWLKMLFVCFWCENAMKWCFDVAFDNLTKNVQLFELITTEKLYLRRGRNSINKESNRTQTSSQKDLANKATEGRLLYWRDSEANRVTFHSKSVRQTKCSGCTSCCNPQEGFVVGLPILGYVPGGSLCALHTMQ